MSWWPARFNLEGQKDSDPVEAKDACAMDQDLPLLDRLLAGEETAFDTLMSKYQRSLCHLAYRLVGNAADAEDLAQQAFVQAYQHMGSFQRQSSFKTWLYRIAINLCKNHRRRLRPSEPLSEEQPLSDGRPGVLSQLIADQRVERLRRALSSLPPRQREVLVLRVYDELPYEQIAAIVGCSENSAKVNFHHAVRSLRRQLNAAAAVRQTSFGELVL
jgi:RNA polymerase sigma-70 factor (ECF subfamily)